MTEPENTNVIRSAYDNFKTGDIRGLLNLFAEDIQWTYPTIPNVLYARNHQGRADVANFFSTLNDVAECTDFSPRTYTAAGDQVITQGSYTFRVRENGRSYTCEFAHFFELKNGMVQNFQEYSDTAAVMIAFEKAMSA
jgi:ketosteroid isomerase-like protein